MSDEEKQKLPRLYTPREVARMFGITEYALKNRRQRGQIEGIKLNDKSTVYTEEQIKAADLSPRKRGPKPRKTKETTQGEEETERSLATA